MARLGGGNRMVSPNLQAPGAVAAFAADFFLT